MKIAIIAAAVLIASAAQAATICDDMASRLRADPAFMAGKVQERPFDLLVKRGVITEPKGEEVDSAAVIARFKLTGKAAKAAEETALEKAWLFTSGSAVMLREQSGSAGCQSFAFFHHGQTSTTLMPQPPLWMDDSLRTLEAGEGIGECLASSGHLAALHGITGFFAVHGGYKGFSSGTDFVPASGKAWGKGCSLSVQTETIYLVKKLIVTEGTTLSRAILAKLAPEIASAFVAARKQWHFSFGPQLPASDFTALKAHADAVYHGKENLPLADKASFEDDHSIDSVAPVNVGGQAYLLKISHETIGWRDLRGFRLSFYRLKQNKPEPVAFVSLDEAAGRVTTISVKNR